MAKALGGCGPSGPTRALLTALFTLAGGTALPDQAALAAPRPIAELSIPNPQTNEYLGASIDVDEDHILISTLIGRTFLYDAHTFALLTTFSPPNGNYRADVALEGTKAVIGCQGTASVYDFSDLAHIKRMDLAASDTSVFGFVTPVDINNGIVIVGHPADNTFGQNAGSAYLFDAQTGAQLAKLEPDDVKPNGNFGADVALDGNRAVIGRTESVDSNNGSVYLFDASRSAAGDRQLAKYSITSGMQGRWFGQHVGLSGDTIVATDELGNAFLWHVGGQPTPLLSPAWRPDDDPIGINGRWAVFGGQEMEKVDLYNHAGQFALSLLRPFNTPIGFGVSVAVSNELLLVSAPGGAPFRSVVHVFRLQEVVPEPGALGLCVVALASGMGFFKR
jgi:hypothetical protein